MNFGRKMSGGGSGSSLLAVEEDSSIIYNTTASHTSSDMNSGLGFSSVSIIIPVVILCLLVFILIGYYIWRCYTQYQELTEAENEEKLKSVKVPIAEPEDFPPIVPLTVTTSPSDDDIVLADRDNLNNVENMDKEGKGNGQNNREPPKPTVTEIP